MTSEVDSYSISFKLIKKDFRHCSNFENKI